MFAPSAEMKKTSKAHIAVLLTNVFFAANYTFVKMVSPALIKPFGLNVYRVGVSLILFWALRIFTKKAARIERGDYMRFFLCGLFGVAINQMFFIKGLTLTSPIHASLLMLTTPLMITVFALWVLKEALTGVKLFGLALGLGGAALIIASKETAAHAPNYLLGDCLILINAVSYSIFFILVKPLMQRYSPVEVIRWVFTIGLLMMLPFGLMQALEVNFPSFTITDCLAFAAVILTGTFLAYYFNAIGLQHLGASVTGSYIYTQPVFAVLIAILFFHDHLSLQKFIAAVLIFTGVYLVGRKKA